MSCSLQECSRYMSSSQITAFLDSAIHSRISIHLIAKQHIALSMALSDLPHLDDMDDLSHYVGIVDPKCSPYHIAKMCGSFVSELCEATLGVSPQVIYDGDLDATFSCVKSTAPPLHSISASLVMFQFILNISLPNFSKTRSALLSSTITGSTAVVLQSSPHPSTLHYPLQDPSFIAINVTSLSEFVTKEGEYHRLT